ncbi:glycosyltransferase family protein [Allorhizobium sp. BGMRC 0089]|uniref:glycosyltransferase family protein n=1 Tax=Allorhizobium sonneratiae TaxID=2934936 RepID=UPI00203422D9|nr:glycosyltransferase family protein [Allorhizobium sonneratiae]MCM2290721.1 glycosyltransferase family protein [Allorhizobium sonneratiae]
MSKRLNNARILMYSHDTFGLGHLRRCRTIAHALVEDFRGLQVLIISGATIAGAFDYRARVDFVKIPSVIKLRNGDYTSMDRHIDLQETLKMRQSIIRHTAESFEPDIFIIDKEPLGLRGEVEDTLAYLKTRGTRLVLGLRDVMDAPHLLDAEWKRNDVMAKIAKLYDDVWVYGPPDFHDPLSGLEVPQALRDKMRFVGFLQRSAYGTPKPDHVPEEDYLLVTTGGGGDGAELVRDFIAAYESDPSLDHKAIVVLGPYMPSEQRQMFMEAGSKLPRLKMIEFDNRLEDLMVGAKAVVAMGGYNTFCEILSFDKPALIVPRTQPRQEQLIRASRGEELGLVNMISAEESANPQAFADAIRQVWTRKPPSVTAPGLQLEGLPTIAAMVEECLARKHPDYLTVVQG